MQRRIWILSIVNLVLLVLLSLVVLSLWQERRGTQVSSLSGGSANHPVLNPKSNTAARYFPDSKGSGAVDFREDGSEGPFRLSFTKNGNTVQLSWDPTLKGVGVAVLNLGRLDDLSDTTQEFRTTYGDAKAGSKLTFLPNPYVVGTVPDGFSVANSSQNKQLAFKSGQRYSIEVDVLDANNKAQRSSYTFTY